MAKKLTRFEDIKPFVTDGNWECDFTLKTVVIFIDEMIQNDGLDVDPDFQRGHVWNEDQQVKWLEYYLRGGKTGRTIYVNHPGWQSGHDIKKNKKLVVLVDGKQRLTAIRKFLDNKLRVFGSHYGDFVDSERMAGTSTMKVNVNTLKSRKAILEWYLGHNGGGTPHTPEELQRVEKLLLEEK